MEIQSPKRQVDPKRIVFMLGAVLIVVGSAISLRWLGEVFGSVLQSIPGVTAFSVSLNPPTPAPNPVKEVAFPIPDPAEASEPKDPWSVDPVPVTSWLCLLPLEHKGVYDAQSLEISEAMQITWWSNLERPMGLLPRTYMLGYLRRISTRDAQGNTRAVPGTAEMIRSGLGATHVLEGSYREEDGELRVQARLLTPTGELRREFAVAAREDLRMAALLCRWVAEEGGIPMSASTRARMAKPLYGEALPSTHAAEWKELRAKPTDPRWDALVKESPVAGVIRLSLAYDQGLNGLLVQLTPPIPAPDAPLWERAARYFWAEATIRKGVQVLELQHVMAQYPGHLAPGAIWNGGMFDQGQKREQFVDAMRQWSARTNDHVVTRTYLAIALSASAWDWRGTGWSNTVTNQAWRQFATLQDESLAIYTALLDREGADPLIGSEMLQLIGSNGNRSDMLALHQKVAARWPDHLDNWSTTLNYTRPRWGGSDSEAMELIDKAMASRPDNPSFGALAIYYFWREITNTGGRNIRDTFNGYAFSYPGFRRQWREAVERLSSPNATNENLALALNATSMGFDAFAARRIVRARPQVHRQVLAAAVDKSTRDSAIYATIWALAEEENWEMVFDIFDLAEGKNPGDLKPRQLEPLQQFLSANPKVAALKPYAEVLSGREAKEPLERLAALPQDDSTKILAMHARLRAGVLTEEDRLTLIAMTQKDLRATSSYLLALHALRDGNKEEAKRMMDRARPAISKNTPWEPVRRDVFEAMGEPSAEEVERLHHVWGAVAKGVATPSEPAVGPGGGS